MTNPNLLRYTKILLRVPGWVIVIFLLLFFVFYNLSLYQTANQTVGKLYDFKLFYGGVSDFNHAGTLYKATDVELSYERLKDKNGNTPIGALPFTLLVQLPLGAAGLIWAVVSLTIFFLGLRAVWKVYPLPKDLLWKAFLLLFILLSFPVSESLQLGTWGLVVAGVDFLVWYYARQNRDKTAGVLLGLIMTIRWQPFPFFFYFLSLKRWLLLLAAIATGFILTTLAFLVFGLDNFLSFINVVLAAGNQGVGEPLDGSLRAYIGNLFREIDKLGLNLFGLSTIVWALISLALLAASLWRSQKLAFDYGFSLLLVTGLLIIPTSWGHYHMVLILPFTLLARKAPWLILAAGLYWATLYFFIDSLLLRQYSFLMGSWITGYLVACYILLWNGQVKKD